LFGREEDQKRRDVHEVGSQSQIEQNTIVH
jgi:hypothetical protein